MAWTEIMTSAHAALARAEWAFEAEIHNRVARELRIATVQAMLTWLKAHYPDSPIRCGYASVLQNCEAEAQTISAKAVLRLHFQAANSDSAYQADHGIGNGPRPSSPTSEGYGRFWKLLTTPSGAWRMNGKGRGRAGKGSV